MKKTFGNIKVGDFVIICYDFSLGLIIKRVVEKSVYDGNIRIVCEHRFLFNIPVNHSNAVRIKNGGSWIFLDPKSYRKFVFKSTNIKLEEIR